MPKKVKVILAVIVFVLAFVIARFWPTSSIEKNYKDESYIINNKPVALVNGFNEEAIPNSSAKVITSYFGNEVKADFNKDGFEDVAFLLTQQTNGTGLFYYVAVALGGKNSYIPLATDLIGDRIAPQTTEYRDDMIIVNYADRKADESFTVAPSVGLSKYYKIIDGQLRAVVPPMADYRDDPTVKAIQKILIAKYPRYAKTLAVNVRQQTDDYAVGAISFEPDAPGGQYLAVKINENWQFVYEGNGSIDCDKIKQTYQFPLEMLADFCD